MVTLGEAQGDHGLWPMVTNSRQSAVYAGCQFAGVVDVPIYPTQAPPQVRYILDNSGARVLLMVRPEKVRVVYLGLVEMLLQFGEELRLAV